MKGHSGSRFHFITNEAMVRRKCKVSLPYPETVIPTELHSEKENEFEGLSMTLILPNTTVLDRIQYRHTKTKQINNLFTKGKTKSTILVASVCSHLTIAFLDAAFLSSLSLSGYFMGPLPAILDSHYCVWVPLFCHPRFRYSEQNTGFLFTKPGIQESHHRTVQLGNVALRRLWLNLRDD